MDTQANFILVFNKEDREFLKSKGFQELYKDDFSHVWTFLNNTSIMTFEQVNSICPRVKYTNILHT